MEDKDINMEELESFIKKAKTILVTNDLLMSSTRISKKELRRAMKTAPDNMKVNVCMMSGRMLFIHHPSNRIR